MKPSRMSSVFKPKAVEPGKAKRGRPPAFDRDVALDAAMRVFWERGYEAASMEELSQAMRLSASSIYSAFGDKEHLFLEAVDRYMAGAGGFGKPILENAPSAREGIECLLMATARELTRDDQPVGCMIALALMYGSEECRTMRAALAGRRQVGQTAIRRLIERDVEMGSLSTQMHANELTTFFVAVIQGMSAQARDGASRETLEVIARLAMKAWPET